MPPLAVLYGVGTYWIVWSLAVGLLVASSFFVRLPVSGLYFPAAALLGSAAAVAVALRSGGWLGAAALALLGLGYGLSLACQSSAGIGGPSCDLGPSFSAHVGELIGAIVLVFRSGSRSGSAAVGRRFFSRRQSLRSPFP
ncbi:MAG TPA: hypothetical protein DCK98_06990 [Chloroflexi bacterium]|nr:hypothetical protein [Chloroflexota bacterium]